MKRKQKLNNYFELNHLANGFFFQKTAENMKKIKKFLDSIDVPAMIKDIDKVENFLEKLKVGLQKMAQVIKWLTNGNIE